MYVELERKNKRDQEEKQVGELSFIYEGKNREEENKGREDTNECMHGHANGTNLDNREMSSTIEDIETNDRIESNKEDEWQQEGVNIKTDGYSACEWK